jgi:hypothetical protein
MPSTVSDDLSLDEEEWLAAPRRRSRLRLGLSALLAASLCFLGGALVQKHLGAEPAASAAGPGSLPGAGTFPGGVSFEGAPTGTGSSAGPVQADPDEEERDAVVGTVVSIDGETWVVEDLGGQRHEVRVTDDAHLVRETGLNPDQVAVGDRVDITGTTADDQLTAEDVTLR